MKKLNLGNITAGLETLKGLQEQNASVARSEQIRADLIDLAEKNSYAADDTEDSIRDLADQIEECGLLNPLGVIEHNGRYTLFSGERRYKAITQYLHWETIPCRVFEGVSVRRAQLMLHVGNGRREYSPALKLALYEEYRQLLEEMKAAGEFKGGIQKGIAELLNISDRQVRTYRAMSEELTVEEKQAVQDGTMSFGEAKAIVSTRTAVSNIKTAKTGTSSAFPQAPVSESSSEANPAPATEEKTGTSSAFSEETSSEPIDKANFAPVAEDKTGTSSGLSSGKATARAVALDPQQRLQLLEDVILSDRIWKRKDLYLYYINEMPTPQEACRNILKPEYGFSGGSLETTDWSGFYKCTAKHLLLEPDSGFCVRYTYIEVDAAMVVHHT